MTGRNQSLDVLRGIAVSMVLLVHLPLAHDTPRLLTLGAYGVDLFFVLSGFLISGLLYNELRKTGRLDLPRFWIRRGLKIWPAYFVAYVPLFLLRVLSAVRYEGLTAGGAKAWAALPNFIFIQNYVGLEHRWFASWSLAIEEHFYLVFPIVLLFLPSVRWVPVVCVLTGIAVLASRLAMVGSVPYDLLYVQTHFRADSLSFGVLLGYLACYHQRVFTRAARRWPVLIVVLLLALAIPLVYPLGRGVTEGFGLTALYLGFGGLVVIAAVFPTLGTDVVVVGRIVKAFAWVGEYSYTIYLAQAAALLLAGQSSRVSGFDVRAAVFVLGSLGGGVLLSHAVERPFLRVRERWFPSATKRRAVDDRPATSDGVDMVATRPVI